MSTALKTIHDQLLAMKPEGASHPADCLLCSDVEVASDTTPEGGNAVSEKTYTEAEYDTLASQVAELEASIAELTAAAKDSELETKVAEATAELEAKVSELQSQLDNAVAEATASKTAHEELVAFLDDAAAAAEAASVLEAKKADRVAAAKEAASFSDDYLDANAERFAAMSDDAWETAVEGWRAIAAKTTGTAAADEIPSETAMTASRSSETNPLREVLDLRFRGIDTRTV